MRFASISNDEVLARRMEVMMHPPIHQSRRAIGAEPWPDETEQGINQAISISCGDYVTTDRLSLLASASFLLAKPSRNHFSQVTNMETGNGHEVPVLPDTALFAAAPYDQPHRTARAFALC